MRQLRAIIQSNQVNLKGFAVADEALEDGARQINERGLPHLMNHDWTRLKGWMNHAWTEKCDQVVELVGQVSIPETENEQKEVLRLYARHLARISDTKLSSYKHLLNDPALADCSMAWDPNCVYLFRPNLLNSLMPEMASTRDDDGLISLNQDILCGQGWLRGGPYLATPHRAFRQSYALPNCLNAEFFGALARAQSRVGGLRVALRFEDDLVGLADSAGLYHECEYWWGPVYKGDPFAIPYGVSVHGPTEKDLELERLKQCEFWWYGKELRTLEIEEVLNAPVYITDSTHSGIGMRFIHSIFDSRTRLPIHLDGALRVYDEETWAKRKTTPIDKFGKNAQRMKLWRVDGAMPLDEWYSLIHTFFKHNFAVAEYFGVGYRG
jgi:hypothetical protein